MKVNHAPTQRIRAKRTVCAFALEASRGHHNARFASSWELSAARATNVTHLRLERGMTASRLSAAGYADTQPVAPNAAAPGRQRSRRTEIVLLPALGELPDLSPLQDQDVVAAPAEH